MSSVTVKLPSSVHSKLEELAKAEGFSLEQFLASAASEKLSAMLQKTYLEDEAELGNTENFKKFINAVPNIKPTSEDTIK